MTTETKSPYIISCSIRTPDGTILCTKHRHDYQTHLDAVTGETYMLDGTGWYYRISVNEVPAELMMVTTDSPFEEQRKVQFWKSYGKDGSLYPDGVYLSLEQMETDHIEAILATQSQIRGTPVQQMFINELEWRKNERKDE